MILVELNTDQFCAIKYNKSMIEIVNPLPATIFSCHFKLLQKLTGLKAPKRLMRNFYLNMPIIIMKYLRGVECNIPKSGIILVIAIVDIQVIYP